MNKMEYAIENEIQRLGLETLAEGEGLCVVGLIRFVQQFDKGHGDYVHDRQEWQQGYSVDSLLEAVAKEE